MIVFKSEGVERSVELLNHCLFCLKKCSSDNEVITVIADGVVCGILARSCSQTLPVNEFNRIWSFIGKKLDSCDIIGEFSAVPQICSGCSGILLTIQNLMKLLDNEIERVKLNLAESISNKRGPEVVKEVADSDLDTQVKEDTIKILEEMGHVTCKKEEPENSFMEVENSDDVGDDPLRIENISSGVHIVAAPVVTKPKKKRIRPSRKKPESEKWKICEMCLAKVPLDKGLQHCRNHVGDFVLECPNPFCNRAFTSIGFLKTHLSCAKKTNCNDYFKEDQFTVCETCGFQGNNQLALRTHLLTTHESGTSRPYSCPVSDCSEQFCLRQTVYFHINQNHSYNPSTKRLWAASDNQKCPGCMEIVSNEDILTHFKDIHKAPEDSIISCNHCPYKSLNRLQLLDHLPIHFRNGVPVSCDMCPDQVHFLNTIDIRKHYLKVHQIGQSYVCEHCTKTFLAKNSLKFHVQKFHTGQESVTVVREFKCELCPEDNPFIVRHADALSSHKIKEHGAPRPTCTKCQLEFKSWRAYRVHERSVHRKVDLPQHPCDIPGCDKVFTLPSQLARHKISATHMGKTNAFVCDECGAGFNTKNILWNHRNYVHSKKKLVCELCGHISKSPHLFRHHMKSHANPSQEVGWTMSTDGRVVRKRNRKTKAESAKGAAPTPVTMKKKVQPEAE